MARGYRRSGRRYYSRRYDAGHEAARRHIEEANALSAELGGMDKEVKSFFFRLHPDNLSQVLELYGRRYGNDKRDYAIETFHKWKAETTHMSGLVAGRLFNLLPPFMPIDLKLRIVEGLWENQGSNKTDYVLVPTSMHNEDVLSFVVTKLFHYVQNQTIPENLKERFNWLSGEDAKVAEQIFRHARNVQLNLKQRIASAIMARAEEVAINNQDVIHSVESTIKVGGHSVSIKRSQWVQEPVIVDQYSFARGNAPLSIHGSYSWIWWLVGIGVLIYLFTR